MVPRTFSAAVLTGMIESTGMSEGGGLSMKHLYKKAPVDCYAHRSKKIEKKA
jgi:hypothetical protein